ncbi:hypothetical protein CCP2SC5_240020 [Azospirillaceae bacterium]
MRNNPRFDFAEGSSHEHGRLLNDVHGLGRRVLLVHWGLWG